MYGVEVNLDSSGCSGVTFCVGQADVAQNRTPSRGFPGAVEWECEACRATHSLFPFTSSKPNSKRIPRPVGDLGHFTHGMPRLFKQNGWHSGCSSPRKFMETYVGVDPPDCVSLHQFGILSRSWLPKCTFPISFCLLAPN